MSDDTGVALEIAAGSYEQAAEELEAVVHHLRAAAQR